MFYRATSSLWPVRRIAPHYCPFAALHLARRRLKKWLSQARRTHRHQPEPSTVLVHSDVDDTIQRLMPCTNSRERHATRITAHPECSFWYRGYASLRACPEV